MSDMTVLVGRNNEGKSNILNALSLAMDIMQRYAKNPRVFSVMQNLIGSERYRWERDYPVSLQSKNPNGKSHIDLVLSLSGEELQEIREQTKIGLNSDLTVRVTIGKRMTDISIPKRGTPAFSNDENMRRTVEFVCGKIDFTFIPAVRTENESLKVLEIIMGRELAKLEEVAEYKAATEQIERLQTRALEEISSRIITTLQAYMPSISNVQLRIQQDRRRVAMRRDVEVLIDDGTLTLIQQKGDGIKSLMALAMLSSNELTDKVSMIAIEEPESHLHPEAARQLFQTISALSKNYQVILTTHSPLFVNRFDVGSNVIVENGKAEPVKNVRDIRTVLGTIISDNLINAENVLIVEGKEDEIALKKLLPNMSADIRRAMKDGTFIIDYLGGSGNLSYKLSLYNNLQCKCHVLLDNDNAGRQAGLDAEAKEPFTTANITYTICNGSPDAELEDCYHIDAYKEAVKSEFGIDITVREFRGKGKWSDRMKKCFLSQGKQWNDQIKGKVKWTVAEAIDPNPDIMLNPDKRSSIDALVRAIEEMLQKQ